MSNLLAFCPADRIFVTQIQKGIFARGPGWFVLTPLVEKKQAEVVVVRYMLPLFPTMDVIEFDLKDKARVLLKRPAISIQLEKDVRENDPARPFKVAGPDFESQIQQYAENALGILNEWSSEDVREMRSKDDEKNIEKHILKNESLNKFVESLGFELKGFVVADFDYTAPVMEMRKKGYETEMRSGIAEMEVSISEFQAISKAKELTEPFIHSLVLSTGKPVEDVQKMISEDKDLQKKILEYYHDLRQRELTNVIDIRNDSKDGIGGGLLPLMAMMMGDYLKGNRERSDSNYIKKDNSSSDDKLQSSKKSHPPRTPQEIANEYYGKKED